MRNFITYHELAILFSTLPKEEAADVIKAAATFSICGKLTMMKSEAATAALELLLSDEVAHE